MSKLTEADMQIDKIADRIGCTWEDLDWDQTDPADPSPALWLLLPNCRVIEVDPDSVRDVARAADQWQQYAGTDAAMVSLDNHHLDPFLSSMAACPGNRIAFGIATRIAANCGPHGRPLASHAIY